MMYLHELWTGALLVEQQESFQKLLPTQSASSMVPTQCDSALETTHKRRRRKSVNYCAFFETVQCLKYCICAD